MGKLLAAASTSSFRQFIPLLHRAIQRTFITGDPVLETHFILQNPVVETGDFSHSYLISGITGTFGRITGMLASVTNEFRINDTNDSINFKFANGTSRTIALDSALDRTKFNVLTLFRVGSTVSVKIEEVTQAATQTDSGTYTIETFGRASTEFNEGIIANVDLGGGNVWKINKAEGNAENSIDRTNILTYNNAPDSTRELFTFNTINTPIGWVGSVQRVVNGGFDTDTDWVIGAGWSISGGIAASDGLSGFATLSQTIINTTVGFTYIKEYDLVSVFGSATNAIREQFLSNVTYGTNDSVGHKRIVFTAVNTFTRFASLDGGGSFDNMSLKRFIGVA